jgi:hypothetical protein
MKKFLLKFSMIVIYNKIEQEIVISFSGPKTENNLLRIF